MRPVRLAGGLHPTAMQEALLRVVAAPNDQLDERWRALQPLDLDRVERGALVFLPLVYLRLTEAGIEDALLPRMKGAYRNVWYRNQLQLERLPKVVEAIASDSILMRDVALATQYYPHTGLRLIAHTELMSADGGSILVPNTVVHDGAPRYLAGPSRRRALFVAFRLRSEERTVGAVAARMLEAGDELLVACAAGAAPTTPPAPQWLLDAWQILVARRIVDPDRVAADAQALGLAPQLRDTLAYLGSVDAALEIDDLHAALNARLSSRRDRLAYHLSARPAGRLGVFPQMVGAHLRTSRSEPAVRVAATLPGYLRDEWGLDGLPQVSVVAARKALTAVWAGPRRGSP